MNARFLTVLAMITGLLIAGPVQQAIAGPNGGSIAVGDFDGDGDSDVMFKNNTDNEIAVWMVEDVLIVAGGGFGGLPPTLQVSGVAFFDDDNISDVLVWDSATSDLSVWFMAVDPGTGLATIGGSSFVGNTGGYEPVAIGQFNPATDSYPDVVTRNAATGDLGIWYTDAGNYAGGGFVGNPTTAYDVLGAGDFNNDGVYSIVFWNDTLKELAFWELTGNQAPSGAVEIFRGSGFGGLTDHFFLNVTDDMNKDNKDDLVLQNGAGDLFVWFMTSDAMTPPTINGFAPTGSAGANKAVAIGQLNPGASGDSYPDIFLEDRVGAPGAVNVGAWLLADGLFAGGGFIGAPLDKYAVANAGE